MLAITLVVCVVLLAVIAFGLLALVGCLQRLVAHHELFKPEVGDGAVATTDPVAAVSPSASILCKTLEEIADGSPRASLLARGALQDYRAQSAA